MNGTVPDEALAPEPVQLDEQIACIERELAFRRRLYPRWVKDGKLTKDAAADELRRMAGVLLTLQRLQRGDEREHPELMEVRQAAYARVLCLLAPHVHTSRWLAIKRQLDGGAA